MGIVTDRSKLEVICRETTIEECRELSLFDRLEQALRESPIAGCGLAAIQIGDAVRASLMVTDKQTYRMVNPVIISQSEPILFAGEACLSQPGKAYSTDRYNRVTVRWLDYDTGVERTAETDGFNAVVIQHEIDHMDGILNYKREHINKPKIGRNDMCPCGSGKKYKKCCINKGG
jgi:peptide deformylase